MNHHHGTDGEAPEQATIITRRDREDLLKICRMRERVARAEVDSVAAERKADFQAKLAAEYSFDQDEIWKQARAVAKEAVERAQTEIARRNAELGIPRTFGPSLNLSWYCRGENASASRRAELSRVANTRIDSDAKRAKLIIGHSSVNIQTKLVASGLESAAAKAFLESMPTPAQLMPLLTVGEVEKQLLGSAWTDDDDDEIATSD